MHPDETMGLFCLFLQGLFVVVVFTVDLPGCLAAFLTWLCALYGGALYGGAMVVRRDTSALYGGAKRHHKIMRGEELPKSSFR